MKNKKLIRDLIEKLEDYNSRDLFEYHIEEIQKLVYDYMYDSGDWTLQDILNEFESYESIEDRAKHELENEGLERLYYFLGCGDVRLDRDYFYVNNYGNLQEITCKDIEIRVDKIIDALKEKL